MTIQVKPTLFLGLGGSGKAVVNHIRTFLLETIGVDGKLPGCFSFLAADLDTNPDVIDGKDAVLSTENDLLAMHIPPFSKIDNKIAEFPADAYEAVSKWWPKGLGTRLAKRFPSSADPDQAFQFRIIGRVAFWINAFTDGGLRNRLSQALDDIRSNDMLIRMTRDFPNLRPLTDQGIDIYIVCSIAGGTGCGMVIDTLAVIRSLLSAKTIESQTTTSTFLLLPEIFARLVGEGQLDVPKCNAYAALKELDHMMVSKEDYVERYPGDLDIHIDGRLSTYLYLVDKQSESNRVFGDRNEIGSRIAKFIFHMSTGLSRHVNQAMGRVKNITGTIPLVRGGDSYVSRAYSGFGFHELVYPRDVYMEYAKHFAAQMLLSKIDEEGNDDIQIVLDFLGEDISGELATWQKRLIPSVPEPQKDFLNVVTTDYKNIPRKKTLANIRQDYIDEKSRINQFFKIQKKNLVMIEKLEEAFNKFVIPEIERAIKDPAHGLKYAIKLCKELGSKVAVMGKTCENEAETYRKRLSKTNPADLVKFKGISETGPFSFMSTWKSREHLIRELLMVAHNDIETLIKALRFELLGEICERLNNDIVAKWKEKLTSLGDNLNYELNKSITNAHSNKEVLELADASWVGCRREDIDEVKSKVVESVNNYVAVLRQEIAKNLTVPSCEFMGGLCNDVIAVTHLNKENILTQVRKAEPDVRKYLGLVAKSQAAPLWSYTGDLDNIDLKCYLLTGFTNKDILDFTSGGKIDGVEGIVTQNFIGDCALRFVTIRDGATANSIAGVQGAYQAYKDMDGIVSIENSDISLPATILRGADEWPELFYEPKKPMDVPSYIRVSKKLGLLQKDKNSNYYTLSLKEEEKRYNGLNNVKKALADDTALSDALQDMVITKTLENFATDAESYLTWAAKNKMPEEITKEIKKRLNLS